MSTTPGQPPRVIVVSGIFPPDVGGPATHAADLQVELEQRGYRVTVLSLTGESRIQRSPGVVRWPRKWPWPLRTAVLALWLVGRRRTYDVVYATGLHVAAVAGARLARRPVVLKIVGDPAWERATRRGLVELSFEEFQNAPASSLADWAMRGLRTWSVRRASAVSVPSRFLAGIVESWQRGVGPTPQVVPNGVRVQAGRSSGAAAERTLRAVVVARLVAHKRVDVVLEAAEMAGGIDVVVIGDGPERGRLETRWGLHDHVTFAGALDRDAVSAHLGGTDILVSASSYEGLPHAVLEAFATGTPVVCSAAGGTDEAVVDGVNGRLVDPPTAAMFAKSMAELRDDGNEVASLSAGALETAGAFSVEACADAVEELLLHSLRRSPLPAVVNIGKSFIGRPPDNQTHRKLGIVARHLDATFITCGPPGVRRTQGVRVIALPRLRPRLLGGLVFYGMAPPLALYVAAVRPGTVVVCQSPFEAAGVLLLRELLSSSRRPRVMVEVHGDWRTASRLYGSPARRLVAPVADAVARWSLRAADRVRAVGPAMEELVRRDGGFHGEVVRFVTFSDFAEFLGRPVQSLPRTPRALFLGVLEPYKGPDILLDSWQDVIGAIPEAVLVLVGVGPMAARLRSQATRLGITENVVFVGRVDPGRVGQLLDDATCLVLPSRSEGLPRVALEAMARGRAVIGSDVGGIPDLVQDGTTGLLVPAGQAGALSSALVELLSDQSGASAMGRAGRQRAEAIDPSRQFEAGIAGLAEWAGSVART